MNGQKRAWRAIPLLAATLAAITLAFLAGCSSIKNDGAAKRDTAAPRSAANLISPHLPFGNPSEAGRAANNGVGEQRNFIQSSG
jgi:hypothetical protein